MLEQTLLRRLLRPLLIGILLLLIWLVVLPYQAAVRIDQALARWAHEQPALQLSRINASPFVRDYQIAWQPMNGTTALRLDLRVHARPGGDWQDGAWHWRWATLRLHVASDSPWQIRQWDQQPIQLVGSVSGLGTWRFTLPKADRAHGNAEARRDPTTGQWQVHANWPGLVLQSQIPPAADSRLLLGRTTLSLSHQSPNTGQRQIPHNEVSLSARRIGWITPVSQGRCDDLELHSSVTTRSDALLGGYFSLSARNLRRADATDPHAAKLRISLSFDGLSPEIGAVLTQCLHTATQAPTLADDPTRAAFWQWLAAKISRDELIHALRHATIRLDALGWRTAQGFWEIDGKAIGPRAAGTAASASSFDTVGWRVAGHLSAAGIAHQWLSEHTTLPPTAEGIGSWLIDYRDGGWQARDATSSLQ